MSCDRCFIFLWLTQRLSPLQCRYVHLITSLPRYLWLTIHWLTLLSPFLPCRFQKVRREYRKFFRAHAGKKIYDFTIQRIVSAARLCKETSPLEFYAPRPHKKKEKKKSISGVLAFVHPQMQKYFLGLKSDMPSMSPIDKKWPARPYRFLDEAHRELQRIFHLWRVGPSTATDNMGTIIFVSMPQ